MSGSIIKEHLWTDWKGWYNTKIMPDGDIKAVLRPKSSVSTSTSSNTYAKGRYSSITRRSSKTEKIPIRPLSRNSDITSDKRKNRRDTVLSNPSTEQSIYQFRRSLRLLGLSPEEIGLDKENDDRFSRPQTRSARPKINTRLNRRTVSAEDLRTAIFSEERIKNTDLPSRELIAKAVYEEWYFKKQDELLKQKDAQLQQEKVKVWEEQHTKREQAMRSKEKYDEWCKNKTNKERANIRKMQQKNNSMNRTKSYSEMKSEDKEAAFNSWKAEKEKLLQKKSEELKNLKLLEEKKVKKREEAEKAFEAWKRKKDEELNEKLKRKEKEEKLKKEEEEMMKRDRYDAAELTFKAWKSKKEKVIQEKINRQRQEEEKLKKAKEESSTERQYEAQQAYLEWLDKVIEKEFSKEENSS